MPIDIFRKCAIMVLPDKQQRRKEVNSMTNTKLLDQLIAESGKKKSYLAKKCGLSLAGFRNCCINKAEFKVSQVDILCAELNITSLKVKQAVFFAASVA